MRDSYEAPLRRIEAPEPPSALIDAARRQASAVAAGTGKRRIGRTGTIGTVALVAAGIAFTPPGQAATEWIAGLAGIGDEPTLEHPYAVPGSVVVFGTGEAPDGTPFEIVAERQSAATLSERVRELHGDAEFEAERGVICPRIDFPRQRVSGGEFCHVLGVGPGYSGLGAMGMSPRDGAPAPLWGTVGPEVAQIQIVLVVPGEARRELDVTLAHLNGELQERVGTDHPFGIFVTFPPIEELPAIGENGARLELIAYDEAGEEIDGKSLLIGSGPFGMPAHPPMLRTTQEDVDRVREETGN